jgi:hypothetical protein
MKHIGACIKGSSVQNITARYAFLLAGFIFPVYCLAVESPVLRGVVGVGGTTYVSLNDRDDPTTRSGWVKVGDAWRGWSVTDVSVSGDWVDVKHERGALRRLILASSRIAGPKEESPSGESLLAPADLDWAWIHSPENEMRDSIIELPADIAISWESMPESERTKIRNFYRRRGIDAGVEKKGNVIRVYHRRLTEPNARPNDPAQLKPIESLRPHPRKDVSPPAPKK